MRDYDSVVKSLRCCVSDSEPCEHCNCELEECNPKTIMDIAVSAIEELLAAVPKQGEWVMSEEFKGYAMCSRCEDAFVDPEWIAKDGKWNYCPNCGARMEPPKEDAK